MNERDDARPDRFHEAGRGTERDAVEDHHTWVSARDRSPQPRRTAYRHDTHGHASAAHRAHNTRVIQIAAGAAGRIAGESEQDATRT